MAFCLETEVTKILNSKLPFTEKMKQMAAYNAIPAQIIAKEEAGYLRTEVYQDAIIHLLKINLTLQARVFESQTIQVPVLKLGDLNAKNHR